MNLTIEKFIFGQIFLQQAEKAFLCLLFHLYSINTVLSVIVFARDVFFILPPNNAMVF